MPDTSEDLFSRLAAGDRLALAEITRMVTARLRRLGAYDLRESWDDICQEVVWGAIRAAREGRGPEPSKTRAYVNRMTWNHFVNALRDRRAGDAESSAAVSLDADGSNGETFELPDFHGSDEAGAHDTRRALAALPPEMQTLLVRRYVEGEKIETLVRESGRSRASVNRDLRRAREAFKERFSGVEPSNPPTDGAATRPAKEEAS